MVGFLDFQEECFNECTSQFLYLYEMKILFPIRQFPSSCFESLFHIKMLSTKHAILCPYSYMSITPLLKQRILFAYMILFGAIWLIITFAIPPSLFHSRSNRVVQMSILLPSCIRLLRVRLHPLRLRGAPPAMSITPCRLCLRLKTPTMISALSCFPFPVSARCSSARLH